MVNFVNKQVNRENYILEICKGKRVLNIGCLAADKKAHLHEKIENVASETFGLDIFDSNIENYTKGDVQNFSYKIKFDVIVIGEVIEHIWNIEGVFKSSYNSLISGGALLVTTPNAYSPVFLKQSIFGVIVPNDPYHVLLFDITTLKNMLNNFANNLFDGDIFFYEEVGSSSLTYKIQKMLAKLKNNYSRGLFLELVKN